jgi:transcriptional regulator with XRE-family HTH domain
MSAKKTSAIQAEALKNRIREIREARNMSQEQLAKKMDTSGAQIDRLEKGQRKLTLEWILRLCAALDVSADELVDLPLKNVNTVRCDQALLGSVIGFLLEACDRIKAEPSRQELSKWTSYVYNDTLERKLNFQQTRNLAGNLVKISKQGGK